MASYHPCKKNRNEVSTAQASALYVHVPFCAAKCAYCDFYSLPLAGDRVGPLIRALGAEARARAGQLDAPLASAFVGGGTPTAVGAEALSKLLAIPAGLVGPATEFSVEANPGTVDSAKAEVLAGAGVNRVNLGVQSFEAGELATLGRIHSADQAREAFSLLRKAGLDNLGLDLIYGIPGQAIESWKRSVAAALELGPEHLSCYGLSFEEGTPLWRELQAGRVAEMDEAEQEACWRHAIAAAAEAGLEHYEISNFARPGRRCRHNITYWENRSYLGLGPGAASFVGGVRQTNDPDLAHYVRAVLAGEPAPSSGEKLTGPPAMAETAMLALRMTQGIDLQAFEGRFGRDVRKVFPASIERYLSKGWLEVVGGYLRIPVSAMFVSNEILADIVAEAQGRQGF